MTETDEVLSAKLSQSVGNENKLSNQTHPGKQSGNVSGNDHKPFNSATVNDHKPYNVGLGNDHKTSSTGAGNDHKSGTGSDRKTSATESVEPKRRVSIASNAIHSDVERNRKFSAVSLETQKRSILMNGGECNTLSPCTHFHQHNHYRTSCGK